MTSIEEEGRHPSPSEASSVSPDLTVTLRHNAIGFPAVLMQAVAQIAPCLALIGALAYNSQLAGLGAPSTFLVAFFLALMVAITVGQLAKFLPSAGGLGTYIGATLGSSPGMQVMWMYGFCMAAAGGAGSAYTGTVISDGLQREYGFHLPWQAIAAVFIVIAFICAYRGIRVSGRALVIASVIEILVLVALGVWCLLFPGPGGVTLSNLNPGNSTSINGFYLAVIFSVFTYTGWEGAAAVAEETRNPRRAIPRAMVGSVIILGVFMVFCSWSIQIGYGTDNVDQLANSTDNPVFAVAERLWGNLGWLALVFALINSIIAVSIAMSNDSSRMWYTLGKAGAMPKYFNFIHPKFQTPTHSVVAQTIYTSIVCFVGGMWIGPETIQFFFGVGATIIIVIVYIFCNAGVLKMYRTTHRSHFNVLLHLVFPIGSTVVLVWVAFKSLYPLPEGPQGWAPLAVGIIFLVGVSSLIRLKTTDYQPNWRQVISAVYSDDQSSDDNRAASRQTQ
jgi:amino acid transporter